MSTTPPPGSDWTAKVGLLITGTTTAYRQGEDDVDSWREPPGPGRGRGGQAGGDLRFFLSEGERVKRFVSATESIAPEERRFLARLIRDRLSSPRY